MVKHQVNVDQKPITRLIRAWKNGDADARQQAMEVLYEPLRQQAAYILNNQHNGHTLSPAALVNELFIRLDKFDFDTPGRHAFKAFSGQVMRNLLVSQIRQRQAQKRACEEITVTIARLADHNSALSADAFLDLNSAMDLLKTVDQRCYQLCEAHYFAGLTYPELAEMFAISEATVTRDLRFARAWLKSKLSQAADYE